MSRYKPANTDWTEHNRWRKRFVMANKIRDGFNVGKHTTCCCHATEQIRAETLEVRFRSCLENSSISITWRILTVDCSWDTDCEHGNDPPLRTLKYLSWQRRMGFLCRGTTCTLFSQCAFPCSKHVLIESTESLTCTILSQQRESEIAPAGENSRSAFLHSIKKVVKEEYVLLGCHLGWCTIQA